jgi:hypothetical protein
MKKEWKKNNDLSYSFLVEEERTGEMDIQFNSTATKAICSIGEKGLEIVRTGFWKTGIEMKDLTGAVVLKAYPEKWYAYTSIVEFENNIYKLIIRNNPLAEFAISKNGTDMLAYGLATDNTRLKVRISTAGNPDFIFDFLLWYLFVPIANENFGDSYVFQMLLSE